MAPPTPPPPPPTGLPVEECVWGLRDALAGRGAAVLQAPPGAGKTTVVPLRLLHEPWLGGGRIVVLEPRRVAARAAARRLAALLGEDVGATVGWVTRDDRRVGPGTRIEVVTEGILTRRLQRDPSLPGVGLVVLDELHERSLQADLALALTLEARSALRPDLRLLVMSATLDGERTATLLGRPGPPAPLVTSVGRQHPVDVRWRPAGRARPAEAAAAASARALREAEGDVLVFLPGAADIARAARLLAERPPDPGVDVHPLHGSLPVPEQDAALAPAPPGRRKVVLATDLAETSLTVEGVGVVVDAGLARVPRFDHRSGLTRLQTVPAPKASAEQRAGRAGRTGPGVAYRLWSKLEHAARRPFADPEITQVDLAGLALELAAWGVADASALPFLDAPPPRALSEGRRLLTELGALDGDGRLTGVGAAMVELPVHPRLARMIVGAGPGEAALACVLAALLDERDVLRGRPDELPVDLAVRAALVADPSARHPHADGVALRQVRQRARRLAARIGAGAPVATADEERVGRLLLLAYPDRVAEARGGAGRFRLRTGAGAWVPAGDPLAPEPFLVVADLDGGRRDARVRQAAAVTLDAVVGAFADDIDEHASLGWDGGRDELVARVERRLGALQLGVVERRPSPGRTTERALLDRVRASRLSVLSWTDEARRLQSRVAFLRSRQPEGDDRWPDLGDAALLRTLDQWLAPLLVGAAGRGDLQAVDVAAALRGRLAPERLADLERLAPDTVPIPSGRRVRVDYDADPPALAVPVQELFGTTATPTVGGGEVPLLLRLLSPAGRPVQVTADLAGFWQGSWYEVRREMAGRYPKHEWPEDPTRAQPPRRGARPRRPRR